MLPPLIKEDRSLRLVGPTAWRGDFVRSMWKDIRLFYKAPINDLRKTLCSLARALCANAFIENQQVCFARLG